VRYQVKYGVNLIKPVRPAGVLSGGRCRWGDSIYMARGELKAMVDEAHTDRVAAHAHRTEGIKTRYRCVVDRAWPLLFR